VEERYGGGGADFWARQPDDQKDVSEGAIRVPVWVIENAEGFVTIATALECCRLAGWLAAHAEFDFEF
jgi:hypothetical protein